MRTAEQLVSEHRASMAVGCSIEKLNYDILHQIFHLLNDDDEEQLLEMPVILSHVCQRWRHYVPDIPTLWSHAGFYGARKYQNWEKQRTFLERSRNKPLDLIIDGGKESRTSLYYDEVEEVLLLVKPYIHRWRSIKVHLPFEAMQIIGKQLRAETATPLEELVLRTWGVLFSGLTRRCRVFEQGFPNLTTWITSVQLLPRSLILPYMPGLRLLHIGDDDEMSRFCNITTGDILYILTRCSQVETLRLLIYEPRILKNPTQRMQTPILLPNLSSLRLHSLFRSDASQVWRYIKAPCLTSIEADLITSYVLPLVASYNPFPGLQALRLGPLFGLRSLQEDLFGLELSVAQNAFSNLSSLVDLTLSLQH
ncbi:hypothetical protein FRC02_003639 [Tulasnella sp. 418]|nr:hypothetical protein FRC02_003639 [Tulasnella sp. 418]